MEEVVLMFGMFAAAVLLGHPLAKALAARISGGKLDTGRLTALEDDLSDTRARLAAAEERLEEAGEKVAFLENLLAQPADAAALPPGHRPG